MKNSSDTIGNQTRNLPACGALPQPTAPPRVPVDTYKQVYYPFPTPIILTTQALQHVPTAIHSHPQEAAIFKDI
jgi:hypothetical protein